MVVCLLVKIGEVILYNVMLGYMVIHQVEMASIQYVCGDTQDFNKNK